MPAPRLIDPELVLHAFAPVEGRDADRARFQLWEMLATCRDQLGMVAPIAETGLPVEVPHDWLDGTPCRPLAAVEQPGADCQAILRRDHDTLNLSVIFGQPRDAAGSEHRRRLRIGSALPVGWVELDQWCDDLAASGTDALLSFVRLYQAKLDTGWQAADGDAAEAIREAFPLLELDPGWWSRRLTVAGTLSLWELFPEQDTRIERRLVVVAPGELESELNSFTWSHGGTAMPPLARYLMHSASLRAQFRAWVGGQRRIAHTRQRLADRVARLHDYVQSAAYDDAAGPPTDPTRQEFVWLHDDLRAAIRLLTCLRDMHQSVAIAAGNMAGAVDGHLLEPSPAGMVADDIAFAAWFGRQIDDAAALLSISYEAAGQLAEAAEPITTPLADTEVCAVTTDTGGGEPFGGSGGPLIPRARRAAPLAPRLGFGIDVVGYGARSHLGKQDAQRRIAELVVTVLADLGLHPRDTDHRGTGNGIDVFLPADVAARPAPQLVQVLIEKLDHDNKRYTDRLRVRTCMVFGPVRAAVSGYLSSATVECDCLLASSPLREAMDDHPEASLALLVSDALYTLVVAEGTTWGHAVPFQRVEVRRTDYHRPAWLWVPPAAG